MTIQIVQNIFPTHQEFHSSIPVVDIKDVHSPEREKREQFMQALHHAMSHVGFFAVINTNVDAEKLTKVYAQAKEFFYQDLEKKEVLKGDCGERGYVGFAGAEAPKEDKTSKRDTKEFFHIGRELAEEELHTLGYHKNLWPKEGENFKECMMDLYYNLEKYIVLVGQGISLAMGEKETFIDEKIVKGDHLMRVIHYPSSLPKNENWAGEHTDLNFFTILPPATCEGLQVKTQEGKWVNVVVPVGAIIVNVGDMLQNLTNGLFRSAVHRVVPNAAGSERFSVVMFAHTRNDCLLGPPTNSIAKTGGIKYYPDATRKELLEYYLVAINRASIEMMQRVVQSGILDRIGALDNPKALEIRDKVIQILKENNLSLL